MSTLRDPRLLYLDLAGHRRRRPPENPTVPARPAVMPPRLVSAKYEVQVWDCW